MADSNSPEFGEDVLCRILSASACSAMTEFVRHSARDAQWDDDFPYDGGQRHRQQGMELRASVVDEFGLEDPVAFSMAYDLAMTRLGLISEGEV